MHVEQPSPRSNQKSAARIPEVIPVFPLPNVVLFPGAYVPLHIFEPRYRDMVADTMAGSQCIGMSLLKDGWEEQYYGNPPVYDVGCVGRLVNVKPLSDGRYDVLLLGLERYEIREQLFDRRYRQARIGVKRTSSVDGLDSRIRAELHRRLTEHLEHMDEEAPWRELLRLQIPDDILVNNLSMSLDLTPVERQFLLEADTLAQRARRLSDLIEFKQHERKDARGLG
jgi:hypothetical protein